MNFKLQILRRASYRTVPWKNGGGITHEVLKVPSDAERFDWRVSIAEIERSGPFSDFAGYSRTMVLLRGAGLHLHIEGCAPRPLQQVGDFAQFDGGVTTRCELLDGPCVDFNLMLAGPSNTAARVERVDVTCEVRAQGAQTTLIFPLEEPIVVEHDAQELQILAPWDLAVLERGAVRIRTQSDRPARALLATFSQ